MRRGTSPRHMTYEEDNDRKHQRFAKDPDAPAVERLHDGGDDTVQERNVPGVEEGVVQPVHVPEAKYEPVERVGGYHTCLQHVQDEQAVDWRGEVSEAGADAQGRLPRKRIARCSVSWKVR